MSYRPRCTLVMKSGMKFQVYDLSMRNLLVKRREHRDNRELMPLWVEFERSPFRRLIYLDAEDVSCIMPYSKDKD